MDKPDRPIDKPDLDPPLTEETKAFLDSYLEPALQIWEDLKADPERFRLLQKWSEERQAAKAAAGESAPGPEASTAYRSESPQTIDGTQLTLPL